MSEDKSFKSFRTTLSEAEYGEYVTGNSHRSAYNDDGTYRIQNPKMLNSINAMLAAIGHATYTDPMEAFNKIRVRLNVFLLDLDWKTFSDLKNKDVGSFVLPINRFGRVDGYDGNSGELRFDGKARDAEGLPAVNLHVDIQLTPDYLYTVHACLRPQGAAPPRSTISPAAATLKRNESVEQVDEVKGLIDVSTRRIKPIPRSPKQARITRFVRLAKRKWPRAAETHQGKNFQTNNEQHEYTKGDVIKSDAAATLKTKIGKAKTAGETTRINPIEDSNAAARAAHRAATTIHKGTNTLRRLNNSYEDTISEEGSGEGTGRASAEEIAAGNAAMKAAAERRAASKLRVKNIITQLRTRISKKTNEDTISEEGKVPFPSGGRNVRFSGLALKTMGDHNRTRSPETAKKFRGTLLKAHKIMAKRDARGIS